MFQNIIGWLEGHQLPCLIKNFFQIDCPSCGIQRSVLELLKGNVEESFKLYPALLAIILFFVLFFMNVKWNIFNHQKYLQIGIPSIFIIILGVYINKLITTI